MYHSFYKIRRHQERSDLGKMAANRNKIRKSRKQLFCLLLAASSGLLACLSLSVSGRGMRFLSHVFFPYLCVCSCFRLLAGTLTPMTAA